MDDFIKELEPLVYSAFGVTDIGLLFDSEQLAAVFSLSSGIAEDAMDILWSYHYE